MRSCITLIVGVAALTGSLGGAAAQYYPPPPPGYPMPAIYPPVPPMPVPAYDPRYDGRAMPVPAYDPRYDERAMPGRDDDDAYPSPTPPYFFPPPQGRLLPQAQPSGGEPVLRPPADIVGTPGSADITGGLRSPGTEPDRAVLAALPPEDQPESGPPKELPPHLRRALVDYPSREPAGTLVIDTPHTYLYLVLGNGKANRYGIGVGREGFTWSGNERISRMSEWPDWHPPKEMIERQPYLPRFMAGGEGNPLGARALYLGNTLYRIHGTNQPSTIGTFVSSGCIRLTNDDIADLYGRVSLGTRVVVLPGPPATTASSQLPAVAR